MPFKNRIRLPLMFTKPQFPVERNVFRLANGTTKVLSMVVRNTIEGKTDQLPEDWHRKLVIALSHDTVTIENERLLSNVVLDADYGIDWQDFLQYPIAQANFVVQVTPFNATNSNCKTCDEVSQVVCVDDTTAQVWGQGTTHEFPDILTANDSICCRPFVITLVTFNTLYFSAVSISASGILTATVINSAPVINNVLIATYRVTCADGSYDEANVYGNITGTSTVCLPAQNLIATQVGFSAALVSWDTIPGASSFVWNLYLSSDLGTPVQSGTLPSGSTSKFFAALTADVSYTFVLVVDCSGGAGTSLSTPVSVVFTINSQSLCGNFLVSYDPTGLPNTASYSYMDCSGNIQNRTLVSFDQQNNCMIMNSGTTTPTYFVADPGVSIQYIALC